MWLPGMEEQMTTRTLQCHGYAIQVAAVPSSSNTAWLTSQGSPAHHWHLKIFLRTWFERPAHFSWECHSSECRWLNQVLCLTLNTFPLFGFFVLIFSLTGLSVVVIAGRGKCPWYIFSNWLPVARTYCLVLSFKGPRESSGSGSR